jgi:PTS system mannose-specific IIA component
MVGIVVVSHGKLGEALISSVEFFVGQLKSIKGLSIWPKESKKEIKHRIQQKMAEIDDGDGVVILTDLMGGTPTNISLSFLEDGKVEVVTGANMPMLLTLSSYRKGKSLKEIARLAKRSGRRSITLAKEIYGRKREVTGEAEKN